MAYEMTARETAFDTAIDALVRDAEDIRLGRSDIPRKGRRKSQYHANWRLINRLAKSGKLEVTVEYHEDYDGV